VPCVKEREKAHQTPTGDSGVEIDPDTLPNTPRHMPVKWASGSRDVRWHVPARASRVIEPSQLSG